MRATLVLLTAVAALGLGAGAARAKTCVGVEFPDRVEAGGRTLVLNGLGLREATVFRVDVYVAALYLTRTSNDAAAILASAGAKELVLRFVHDVTDDELTEAWEEGFAKNAKAELPTLRDRIDTLNGWMTEMKSGDEMSFLYEPGTGVHVEVNGTRKGTIPGDDFARAFFSIWLGSEPPNAGMKEGLLGGACG